MMVKACAVGLAAIALVATACGPTRPGESWVVESGGFHGPRGNGTHYVTCIPASDLRLDRSDRMRWREIKVSADQSYNAEPGDPCPTGPVLEAVG